jgi:hypothetical protein
MIIWSGLGILIPVIAIAGIVFGTMIAGALGQTHLGPGIGLVVAALANFGVWKMIYPKKPRVLVDPATGQQVLMPPKHGLFFIPAKAWTWLLAILAVPALFMGVIGSRAEAEAAAKPGYKEFEAANDLIGSSSKGTVHGNTASAREAASGFSDTMKEMTDMLFTGGSKKNLLTDGAFLTYCHEDSDSVVFLCHVPSLRSYKSDDVQSGLDSVAWAAANRALAKIEGAGDRKLVVGLRGISSYGSILSGQVGAEAPDKATDTHDRSIFFAAFAPQQ